MSPSATFSLLLIAGSLLLVSSAAADQQRARRSPDKLPLPILAPESGCFPDAWHAALAAETKELGNLGNCGVAVVKVLSVDDVNATNEFPPRATLATIKDIRGTTLKIPYEVSWVEHYSSMCGVGEEEGRQAWLKLPAAGPVPGSKLIVVLGRTQKHEPLEVTRGYVFPHTAEREAQVIRAIKTYNAFKQRELEESHSNYASLGEWKRPLERRYLAQLLEKYPFVALVETVRWGPDGDFTPVFRINRLIRFRGHRQWSSVETSLDPELYKALFDEETKGRQQYLLFSTPPAQSGDSSEAYSTLAKVFPFDEAVEREIEAVDRSRGHKG